ncbi:acetyltransferase [Gloeomargarita lithophora Alchichica-D10]|uniref:Acetyltransferase n=1 Tax=Gloeomargarita lithophora Alchichica-D10 TaxID=1188229 RepID=A0A1J0ADI1_9CYAN|nr:GNAT family N-acetyltransferase [Gloeomargarita lithophora]APB33967.1 acetyltransferase [Gloeomargarita lithophora Alchichica-D10]
MSIIETERLIFTHLTLDDVTDTYLSWLVDPEINSYLESRHQEHTMESLYKYVESINHNCNNYFLKIITKNTHEHIGNIKVCTKSYQVADIGIMIGAKNYWGKGIGAESITTITDWAFTDLDLKKLEAGCYEQNLASLRAFLKTGYVVEGFLQSHVVIDKKRYGCFLLGRVFQERL